MTFYKILGVLCYGLCYFEVEIPILIVFGTDDLLFKDYFDCNMKIIQTIKRANTIVLQGERHLMEMDCAERMASETIFFIDESKKNY